MTHLVLITDLDNTLYNWKDFFATALRASIHLLSRRTGVAEDDIYESFRELYAQRGTLEYYYFASDIKPIRIWQRHTLSKRDYEVDSLLSNGLHLYDFTEEIIKSDDAIEFASNSAFELDLFKSLPDAVAAELDKELGTVWRIMMRYHLQAYDGVKETLSWAVGSGIQVIGLTNAPIFQAEKRLRFLGLSKYFYGLAGWDWWDGQVPHNESSALNHRRYRKDKGRYESTIKRHWFLRTSDLKPNEEAYLQILNSLDVQANQAAVIGDSLNKDIFPAQKLGATTIWAQYGMFCRSDSTETLKRVTHWSPKEISAELETATITPDYVVNSFRSLRNILVAPQMMLPGFDK